MRKLSFIVLSTLFLSSSAFSAEIIELSCPDLARETTGKFIVKLAEDFLVENSGSVLKNQSIIYTYDKTGKNTSMSSEDTAYFQDRGHSGNFVLGYGSYYAEDGYLRITRDTSQREPTYSAFVIGVNYGLDLEPGMTSKCDVISSSD